MHGELDVRTARLDADRPDDGEAGVSHPLILPVGERQCRGDRDRVAGVHAAGVEVFDGADHDGVVVRVAHHLHLIFLPAEDRLLDEHFADRREIKASLHLLVELLAIERDSGTRAAEREAGADHGGQADLGEHLSRLWQTLHDPTAAGLEADLPHRLLEDLAVLTAADRIAPGTDHLDAMFCEHAVAFQLQSEIEGRLAAERGEHGVGLLHLDHLLQHLPGERLDVGAVGRARIGHDRGRV